jgi:predicted small metal-binding protein
MPYVCECEALGYTCQWLCEAESSTKAVQAIVSHLGERHAIAESSETMSDHLKKYVRKVEKSTDSADNGADRKASARHRLRAGRLATLLRIGARKEQE